MPKCLKCKDSIFEVQHLRFCPKIKKQIVEVIVPCSVCQGCKMPLMDNNQMNDLRRTSADKYREMKNLLTSKEMIAFREKLKMSQTAFACFLNVGEASIKRWETYYIQDKSQDDHIRIKCDEIYSESHCLYLKYKYGGVDIYSGLKSFSPDLVKQVSQHFGQNLPKCDDHLRKLHFYSDFLHFKRHNKCITGLRYVPSKSGPSPYYYNVSSNSIDGKTTSSFSSSFDDNEKQTLEDVCSFFLRDSGQMVSAFSAQEKGYIETNESHFISYGYAKDLLI